MLATLSLSIFILSLIPMSFKVKGCICSTSIMSGTIQGCPFLALLTNLLSILSLPSELFKSPGKAATFIITVGNS